MCSSLGLSCLGLSVIPGLGWLFSFPCQGSFQLLSLQIFSQVLCLFLLLAKSRQSCPTLCDPVDGSPPGSFVPGILQTRTLEWVAISFSSAWKWKMKVKSLSRVQLLATPRTPARQAPPSLGFSRQEHWSGLPFPSPYETPIMWMLMHLMLSHRSLRLSSFFFFLNSFFCILFCGIDLHHCALQVIYLFFASVILLLIPSSVLFSLWFLFFSSSRSLICISCISSIVFLRPWIIFTVIILNSFSGRLPISTSFSCFLRGFVLSLH